MQNGLTIPRMSYRKRVYFGSNGELYMNASGESASRFARVYAPSAEKIRWMLFQIRTRRKWSRAALAAVLGVGKDTLRRWEDGSRSPCSSARKLVWFVYLLLFQPKELLSDLDTLVTWGQAGREETLVLEPCGEPTGVGGRGEQTGTPGLDSRT